MTSLRSSSLLLLLLSSPLRGVQADGQTTGTDVTVLTGTKSLSTKELETPTGSYQTFSSQITLGSTAVSGSDTSVLANATGSASDSANTLTFLTGSNTPTTTTSTTASGNFSTSATSTSSSPVPTNTRPCNNYAEFCQRKYSNITMVAAHNSPFVKPGNAAANQELDVTTQLNDGVRFLQGQMQWPTNGTEPHFCHTTCDLLDAGPITAWLGKVKDWVAGHPYDVVTILLENGNFSQPSLYAPFIQSTGIDQYAYQPPVLPMRLDDWPTLSEMIIQGRRVVMFLDYMANQTAYPWLLDEFSQLWETPFDPTDQAFPCTVQRPPGLSPDDARARLYMINHNLNVDVSLLGADILVPATSLLNQTNNATGFGSLGLAANQCAVAWGGRPPNFLNVDYYNYGQPPGSVFEVAALMNNVTYSGPCCGQKASAAAATVAARTAGTSLWFAAAVMAFVVYL